MLTRMSIVRFHIVKRLHIFAGMILDVADKIEDKMVSKFDD